jgi:hypothetical protein
MRKLGIGEVGRTAFGPGFDVIDGNVVPRQWLSADAARRALIAIPKNTALF